MSREAQTHIPLKTEANLTKDSTNLGLSKGVGATLYPVTTFFILYLYRNPPTP